jgi:transposase
MLMPTNHVKIHVYSEPCDMRWGYDRLAGLCSSAMGIEPYSGQMFLFFNKAKNRARVFYYDGTGCCLFSKRLEIGSFQITHGRSKGLVIQASELMLLIGGHPLPKKHTKPKWDPNGRQY